MSNAVQTNSADTGVAPQQDQGSVLFESVLKEEFQVVRERRKKLAKENLTDDLSGLALSGGGIRSAAFSLGVLQGLAEVGLLGRFDYLSTVSGGGYIGAWYSRWVHEAGQAKVLEELQSAAKRGYGTLEPPEIQHIRDYSNYLTPQPGCFSTDGWTLIAIYVRNLILNQAVLLLAVIAVLCAVLATAQGFALVRHWGPKWPSELTDYWGDLALIAITLALGAGACRVTVRRLRAASHEPVTTEPVATEQNGKQNTPRPVWNEPWLWYLLTTVGVSACSLQDVWLRCEFVQRAYLILPVLCAGMGGWVALASSLRKQWLLTIGAGVMAGMICGVVWDIGLHQLLALSSTSDGTAFVPTLATFGPPLGLLSVALSMFLTVGFGGQGFTEHDRELWARLSSKLIITALGWAAAFFLVLFGPYLLMQLLHGDWRVGALAGTGWLSLVGAGLRFASGSQTGRPGQTGYRDLIARFAPPLFLLVLLTLVSTGFIYVGYKFYAWTNSDQSFGFFEQRQHLLHNLDELKSWQPGEPTIPTHGCVILTVVIASLIALFSARSLGQRVGVNRFSLHALYANRITRCFVAAARRDRKPNEDTDIDPRDDIRLSALREPKMGEPGPIHLVNTALNRRGRKSDRTTSEAKADATSQSKQTLTTGRSALSERQAESFVLSPWYCGSEATKYCRTEDFSGEPDLGTAIAVSGAAVSSNMGYHSDPLVRVMLTVFNLRLGAWFKTPRVRAKRADNGKHWSYNPAAASQLLWKELTGKVDTASDEVYLSDGGHFENTGVYELLRRRCRFIVVVDAGADPQFQENIGRLVRLARIDLGVEIELDPTIVTPDAQNRTTTHMLAGRIHYQSVQATKERRDPTFNPAASTQVGPSQGVILWFKNALTGDESGDVKHYAATHPEFPYESTTDQFFSESQFESYRALGLHTIRATLGRIPDCDGPVSGSPVADPKSWFEAETLPRSFERVHNNWLRLPHGAVQIYVEGNGDYARILGQLRQEPLLARLYEQVYGSGEAATVATQSDADLRDQHRAEETAIGQMFALLESVWLALDLDQNERHPIYSGWMKVIDHWLAADRVQQFWAIDSYEKTWPRMKAEFSEAFRAFIKRRWNWLKNNTTENPNGTRTMSRA
jgi:predicted acylesterase/phospholipase RssA